MIKLDYTFTKKYIEREKLVLDYSNYSYSEIQYRFAEGSFIYKINDKDFSPSWDWLPLLGFAIDHFILLRELPKNKKTIYGFTDNTCEISYSFINDNVTLSTNYGINQGEETAVEYHKMLSAFVQLFKNVHAHTLKEIPQFRENQYMKEIFIKYPELLKARE
jgi:hypothetical protein